MNIDDYLERGFAFIAEGVGDELVDFLEEATDAFPESAALWCLRGDALQLYEGGRKFRARDYEVCYLRAIEADAECADAWQSLGYVQDVYFDEFHDAEHSFRRALACGAGEEAYLGLARVLAQQNRGYDALHLLSPKKCPYAASAPIMTLRSEILHGQWEPR